MRFDPLIILVAPALAGATAPGWAVEYLTVEAAQRALIPQATAWVAQPLALDDAQRARIKELSGVRQRHSTQQVWRAEREGAVLGWLIVDDVVGKHEFITYACAIDPAGRVLGVEILIYRETHGGQVRDAAWRAHFAGKTLADRFVLDADIPNISGATLSSRNVMNGVKRLLALHRIALAER